MKNLLFQIDYTIAKLIKKSNLKNFVKLTAFEKKNSFRFFRKIYEIVHISFPRKNCKSSFSQNDLNAMFKFRVVQSHIQYSMQGPMQKKIELANFYKILIHFFIVLVLYQSNQKLLLSQDSCQTLNFRNFLTVNILTNVIVYFSGSLENVKPNLVGMPSSMSLLIQKQVSNCIKIQMMA